MLSSYKLRTGKKIKIKIHPPSNQSHLLRNMLYSFPNTCFSFPMGTAAGEGEGCRRKSPPSREEGAHHIHVCVVRPAPSLFLVHAGHRLTWQQRHSCLLCAPVQGVLRTHPVLMQPEQGCLLTQANKPARQDRFSTST